MLRVVTIKIDASSVSWGFRIRQLNLCNKCPDMTQNHRMLKIQSKSFGKYVGYLITLSLALLQGASWLKVEVLVTVRFIGQIEQSNRLPYLKPSTKWLMLNWIINNNTWNHLTVCKQIICIKLAKNKLW